jgi:hypothetical protein
LFFSSTFGVAKINTCYINDDNKTDILGFYPGHFSWKENNGALSIIENQSPNLSIYPNPTYGILSIDSEIQISKIEIYDNSGKLVLS